MGWHFVYLADEDVPAELPVEINAFKSQQRRWAKGVVQVGIKLFRRMWHDPRLSARVETGAVLPPDRKPGRPAGDCARAYQSADTESFVTTRDCFTCSCLDVPILTFSTVSVIVYYLVTQRYLTTRTPGSINQYFRS